MKIVTEHDYIGQSSDHPWQSKFVVLQYGQGGYSFFPHAMYRNWFDDEVDTGQLFIGRCSGLGVGTVVNCDTEHQCLRIGRFVSGGQRLRFLLNGQHHTQTISTAMLGIHGMGLQHPYPPQYADSVIKNDVWLGDEVMMLGGGVVENGCIIGARSLITDCP